jgi:DNA polymerase III delta prime subunit
MKQIIYNDLFNHKNEEKEILDFLNNFDDKNISKTSGLYLLGPPGSGKTTFIKSIIDKENYDIISYDASDIRTKNVISTIVGCNMAKYNVIDMFAKRKKKIVTIMDEMDYMNCGDKGGIKELIKITRGKKTKKQLQESYSTTPIIYIGTNDNDKKIKELISACKIVHFTTPTTKEIKNFIIKLMPDLKNNDYLIENMVDYANCNLQKINVLYEIYKKNSKNKNELFNNLFTQNNYNKYTKKIVSNLYSKYIPISEYNNIIKDTDRTTLGLLWHENIAQIFNKQLNLKLYNDILKNLCFSDYIDRIIFQNQIWQLSEQNSLIKIFYNNYLLHNLLKKIKIPNEIIFTKVLTKYSTEYNNYLFLHQLEQILFCDKYNIILIFLNLDDDELINSFLINKLDVDRMRRFIENSKIIELYE